MTAELDIVASAAAASKSSAPFFSVCIPQYNRTSFLLGCLESLRVQTLAEFEVCIADDCSTDGRGEEIIAFLRASGMDFVYARQRSNRRYDGNLRGAMSLARGEYMFLLGNDDRIARADTLERLRDVCLAAGRPAVALTNYSSIATGRVFERVSGTGIVGSGVAAACARFRDFAFVSGVILNGAAAKRCATDRWDGSEMYQMYIGCRLLAEGGSLAAAPAICIEKDIDIPGETVDSYASKRIAKRDLTPVVLPMARIAPLVADAIAPFVASRALRSAVRRIYAQLLRYTYAYWLIELRRAHSWRYSASVYRAVAPWRVLRTMRLGAVNRAYLSLLYAGVGAAGLLMPAGIFGRLEPLLYRIAKRGAAWT